MVTVVMNPAAAPMAIVSLSAHELQSGCHLPIARRTAHSTLCEKSLAAVIANTVSRVYVLLPEQLMAMRDCQTSSTKSSPTA